MTEQILNTETEVVTSEDSTNVEAQQNEQKSEPITNQEEKHQKIFNNLYAIDVTSHLEEKNGLSYLSWSWAWAELLKVYPTAKYEFKLFKDANGNEVPFQDLGELGCLVHTSITVDGMTRVMSLPVMDPANKAMKTHEYKYIVKTKKGDEYERTVAAYDIMDINKSLWRCLVKNIAMFGLGLKVYSGDDLPPEVDPVTGEVKQKTYRQLKKGDGSGGYKASETDIASDKQIALIKKMYTEQSLTGVCKQLKIDDISKISKANASKLIEMAKQAKQSANQN